MTKVFSEDAYCLGLLYSYIYAGKKTVSKERLEKFHQTIEINLENMNSNINDMYATLWHDNEPSIYYVTTGNAGKIYYNLYPNFNINHARQKYIVGLSKDTIVASKKENALNSLDLTKENGKIVKKRKNKLEKPSYIRKDQPVKKLVKTRFNKF